MWYWNWETFFVALTATIVFMVAVSIVASTIARAVRSVRSQPRFAVKLEVYADDAEKGEIAANFGSEAALKAFVADWRKPKADVR